MPGPTHSLTVSAWLRWNAVSRWLPADPATQVLEVGCGVGGLSQLLAERYRYTAVEMDETAARRASVRVTPLGGSVITGSTDALGDTFRADLVCAFEVLEHIEDDRTALEDWSSKLSPGGVLLVTTPGYPARFGPADARVGHWRRYDPATLRDLLRDVGLAEVEVYHYGGPVSFVLDAIRQRLAKLDERRAPADKHAATLKSGRLLQPRGSLAARMTQIAAYPATLIERMFPDRGIGLIAVGRRPTS
jgi:SAM-dependent methyltransferase